MKRDDFKKSPEELREYLIFRRRGSEVAPRKGKGSYKRKPKHQNKYMACSTNQVQVPSLSSQKCQFESGAGHHAGQSSWLTHQVHTLEISGSNPDPATIEVIVVGHFKLI